LLDKLLLSWKARSETVLAKLLDLNKQLKTATGAEKNKLTAPVKTLTTEMDKRDRMPTLKTLASEPLDKKTAQLK